MALQLNTGGVVTTSLTPLAQHVDIENTRTTQRTAATNYINAAITAVGDINNESTEAELNSAQKAIDDAEKKVSEATALEEEERGRLLDQVNYQKTVLSRKRTSRTTHMNQQMATNSRHLYAALGPATEDTDTDGMMTALDNIVATHSIAQTNTRRNVLTSSGLSIDAVAGAGALPDAGDGSDPGAVTLKPGEAATSLSGWSGRHYAHTNSGTKVKNEALVYTDQAAPTVQTFKAWAEGLATPIPIETSDGPNKDSIAVSNTANLNRIDVEAFKHSGRQVHRFASGSSEIRVRGKYNGAQGTYRCTGARCSSTNNGGVNPTALEGTWRFFPDQDAMVSIPDPHYVFYGWWLSKDKDGMPTAASAFTGQAGNGLAAIWFDGTDITRMNAGTFTNLTGSATYSGNAVGKFAMNNAVEGTSNSGHFTADAELRADFEPGGGVTGTIDNFRLNGGSEDPNWSVTLNRHETAPFEDFGGITGPASDATVWSINGNKAAASGSWSGHMYEGTPSGTPLDDGNSLPDTVTGTFYSEFGSSGRMVGAFGAKRE